MPTRLNLVINYHPPNQYYYRHVPPNPPIHPSFKGGLRSSSMIGRIDSIKAGCTSCSGVK